MTTYSVNAPQFGAVQYTGSNASAVQSFINTSASWAGVHVVTDTSSNAYLTWLDGNTPLSVDGWVVYNVDTTGTGQSLPLPAAGGITPPGSTAPVFYVFESATFTAMFS